MSRNDGHAVVTGATQIGGVVGASEHEDGSTVTASRSSGADLRVGEREHRPVLAGLHADRGGGCVARDHPELVDPILREGLEPGALQVDATLAGRERGRDRSAQRGILRLELEHRRLLGHLRAAEHGRAHDRAADEQHQRRGHGDERAPAGLRLEPVAMRVPRRARARSSRRRSPGAGRPVRGRRPAGPRPLRTRSRGAGTPRSRGRARPSRARARPAPADRARRSNGTR